MTIKFALIELFKHNRELTIKEITARLQVSKQMVHIAINQLVDERHPEKLAGLAIVGSFKRFDVISDV